MMSGALGTASPTMNGKVGRAVPSAPQWCSCPDAPGRRAFYRVQVTPMSSNSLLAATVLNRLTYGPTPDEIERINAIGPDAYIAEQLAPWSFAEDVTGTSGYIPLFESKFAEATN